MKILHINKLPKGGAFNGTYRLHTALLKAGIDSKILVREAIEEKSSLNQVYEYNQPCRKINIFNSIINRLGHPSTTAQRRWHLLKGKKGSYEILSLPISDFDITQSKEYQQADIINLHWVADYLDYQSFFKKCLKPVVITLRDLFPLQGIFHYSQDVITNKKTFGHVEDKMVELKKKSISSAKKPVVVVGISKWITEESRKSEAHQNLKHYTVHNCIDVGQYQIFDKKKLRNKYRIPFEADIFSFISEGAVNLR